MGGDLGRFVLSPTCSDVVSMALMVYSIPRVILKVEALAVFPGLGEYQRVKDATTWWQNGSGDYLFIAGINPNEKTWRSLDARQLAEEPFFLSRRLQHVKSQIYAANTKEQAEWIYQCAVTYNIHSIALFASPFHCLRAYLTLLKTCIAHGKSDIILVPAPTPISPTRLIPENQKSAWDLVPGEVQRIIDYQKKGDVATQEELTRYLQWLWEQSFMGDGEVKCDV